MEYLSTMIWLTTKQASTKYLKSVSTIKRLMSQADASELKYEPNKTAANRRVFVSSKYLDRYFGIKDNTQDNTDMIAILERELIRKQETIDKLLETQQENLRRQQEQLHLLNDAMRRENLLLEHFNRNKDLNKEQKTDEDFINESDIEDVFEEQPKQDEPINIDSYEDFTTWLKSMNG